MGEDSEANTGDKMKAWHFTGEKLRGGREIPKDGEWLNHSGELKMCESGLHASTRLIDALKYSPGSTICRVEISGETIKDTDKVVARKRKILWRLDATMILHEFACLIAEKALKEAKVTDERCWNAIKVKRQWMQKKATDEELGAASSAASSAAESAAYSAACRAVNSAASAAWSAAYSAAYSAAESAARSAAWSAAESAAYSAAESAAYSAAKSANNKILERLVMKAHNKASRRKSK